MSTSMDGNPVKLPPLLMLPSVRRDTPPDSSSCSFFSLELRRYLSTSPHLREGRCVGSSNGHLILLDRECNPFLLNPFDGRCLSLPPLNTFPCILSTYCSHDGALHAHYRARALGLFNNTFFVPVKTLRESFIRKAIVATFPRLCPMEGIDFFVVAICGDDLRLVYARPGDRSWKEFQEGGNRRSYHDVICYSGTVYALSDEGFIRAWDMKARTPRIVMDIESSFPKRSEEFVTSTTKGLYSSNNYLVETDGRFLLVVRLIGEFVNRDNEPVTESDLLTDADTHPLVCPYRTLHFHVYTLDKESQSWMAVDNIGVGGQALFIGGSESTSVSAAKFPGCEPDSIYFTDDYWERVDEDYLYGGHDIGVYNIRTGHIGEFCELGSDKVVPPPFWVMQSWKQRQRLTEFL